MVHLFNKPLFYNSLSRFHSAWYTTWYLTPFFKWSFQVSGSLPALQEHAESASKAFCQRFIKPSRRKSHRTNHHAKPEKTFSFRKNAAPGKFYRPRDHEASPFFKIVRNHFNDFEQQYPDKYQERYGYWRPIIRSSIDKFLTSQRAIKRLGWKPVFLTKQNVVTTAVILKRALLVCVARTARKSFS